MLSTGSILLAVLALAIAAPENYGSYGQSKPNVKPNIKANIKNKPILTTTLANDIPAEFDCAGKDDGGYVIGCSQDYFLCWKGVMTKSSCPEGMVFNQENGQCDFNINVFECTGVKTTTLAAEPSTTLKPVDFDCSKLTDGDYALTKDCQLSYVSCVGGQGVERTCPEGLSFDPENRLCDHLENIEACGGSPTTVAPTMEIKFDCPSPSGSFALTSQLCSAVYYICNDNVATIAICDDPMIWDDSKKVCALPKDIPDCSFDCAGKADAAYSEGCAQTYWWCWQERATKLSCPDMMMFDAERQMCDFKDNVFECTGVKTTTLAAEPIPTLPPVDFDCSAVEDGQHAFTNGEKCQAKFVSCVGGHAWEMTCPEGLLFDPDMLQCERIDAIVACGGTAEPISTTTKDYSYKPTTTLPKVTLPKKKITKAPYTTTIADVPTTTESYGSYDQTTLADEPITTTRKAYGQRTTKLADLPTTRRHHQRKTTTLADMPTTRAYGNYQTTTPLADVPTTKAYNQRKTTTLADMPTTVAYGDYETTTLADVPTTKAYNQRKTTTLADLPTTRRVRHHKTTTVADEPITTTLGYNYDSYESILIAEPTTRRRMHKTTTIADVPSTTESYGSYDQTTLEDEPITTTRSSYGGYQTTVADLPTTRRHHRKTTTLADLPTTRSYGGYQTSTLADVPTTKAYGFKRTTTLADVPTTKGYGFKRTTTIADVPTTKGYGFKRTTTLADVPTTKSYGFKRTTTIADVPTTTDSYGSYDQTTLADIPTTRRRMHKTTTIADMPTTESYGSYDQTTLEDEPITTTRSSYGGYQTTLADLPTTRRHHQRKTTTLADLPTTRAYGGYQTSTLADLPITTMRPRSYTKLVKAVPTTRKFIQQNQY